MQYSFLSKDGEVSFDCCRDPRNGDGYVHYFGCTGEYENAKKLESWFKENAEFEDLVYWSRQYI